MRGWPAQAAFAFCECCHKLLLPERDQVHTCATNGVYMVRCYACWLNEGLGALLALIEAGVVEVVDTETQAA